MTELPSPAHNASKVGSDDVSTAGRRTGAIGAGVHAVAGPACLPLRLPGATAAVVPLSTGNMRKLSACAPSVPVDGSRSHGRKCSTVDSDFSGGDTAAADDLCCGGMAVAVPAAALAGFSAAVVGLSLRV